MTQRFRAPGFLGAIDDFGTHRPLLLGCVRHLVEVGLVMECRRHAVLELGMGRGSTIPLHILSREIERQIPGCGLAVYSYENNAEWCSTLRAELEVLGLGGHDRLGGLVADWAEVPIERVPWALALVDHAPGERRVEEIRRLREARCLLCVVHDTQEAGYGYERELREWRFRYDDKARRPWTTVVSNVVPVGPWLLELATET